MSNPFPFSLLLCARKVAMGLALLRSAAGPLGCWGSRLVLKASWEPHRGEKAKDRSQRDRQREKQRDRQRNEIQEDILRDRERWTDLETGWESTQRKAQAEKQRERQQASTEGAGGSERGR